MEVTALTNNNNTYWLSSPSLASGWQRKNKMDHTKQAGIYLHWYSHSRASDQLLPRKWTQTHTQWVHPWQLIHLQYNILHLVSCHLLNGRPSQSSFACHMLCMSDPMQGTSMTCQLIQLHHADGYHNLYMCSAMVLFMSWPFHVCGSQLIGLRFGPTFVGDTPTSETLLCPRHQIFCLDLAWPFQNASA